MLKNIKLIFVLLFMLLATAVIGADNYLIVKDVFGKAFYQYPGDQTRNPISFTGVKLKKGMKVITGANSRLILSYPNDAGTKITLNARTVITIDKLITSGNKNASSFFMPTGRMKAAVSSLFGNDFKIRTKSAVAGIRGTIFAVDAGRSGKSQILVFEGKVAVQKVNSMGETFGRAKMLVKNQKLGVTLNKGFSKIQTLSASDFSGFGEKTTGDTPADKNPAKDPVKDPVDTKTPVNTQIPVTPKKTNNSSSSTSSGSSGSALGMAGGVGTVVLDDKTWTKMLFTPKLKVGKLEIALYLPVYYDAAAEDGLFDTSKWYNADEWDFKDFKDILHDFLLKILYVQYGEKGDKFYSKLGNIDDFTIGHGFLMNKYSNMENFPDIRRVGLVLDLNFKNWGIETMIADIYRADIVGSRFYIKPFGGILKSLAFGISTVADFNPDPNASVFAVGIDSELTLPNLGILTWKLFIDAAKNGYKVKNTFEGVTLAGTAVTNTAQDFDMAGGTGLTYGVMGRILFFNYKIAYRQLLNGFIPEYFDSRYESLRQFNVATLISGERSDYKGWVMEMGVDIGKVGLLQANFQEYYGQVDDVDVTNNRLLITAQMNEGIIPKFHFSFEYERININFQELIDNFFGADTITTLKLYYDISEGISAVATYRRFYDANGNHDESYGIETQFNF